MATAVVQTATLGAVFTRVPRETLALPWRIPRTLKAPSVARTIVVAGAV